jgi:hypothetical protein
MKDSKSAGWGSHWPVRCWHRLNLRLRDDGGMMSGVNGTVAVQTALVNQLKIGAFAADDLLLRVAGNRLGVSDTDFGVVLGSDFFRHFDTEFDLGHDVVRLLKAQNCKPELPEENTAGFTYNGGPVFQVVRPNTP